MKICIDNRERTRSLTIDRVALFENYIKSGKTKFIDSVKTDNYKAGDYFTEDMLVGVEYKKDDFVESIYNGQLDKQLKELKDNFAHPYLFVGYDGNKELLMENLGVNPDVLIGQLTSVLARHHMPVIFVGDMLVRYVCDVIEKHYDGKTPVKNIEYTPLRRQATTKEIKVDIISRIPGIGPKKGLKLIETFDNSIGNISKASNEELIQIPGIGEVLANHIKEVLK